MGRRCGFWGKPENGRLFHSQWFGKSKIQYLQQKINAMSLFVVLNCFPSSPTQGLKQTSPKQEPPAWSFLMPQELPVSARLLAIRSVTATKISGREEGKSVPQTVWQKSPEVHAQHMFLWLKLGLISISEPCSTFCVNISQDLLGRVKISKWNSPAFLFRSHPLPVPISVSPPSLHPSCLSGHHHIPESGLQEGLSSRLWVPHWFLLSQQVPRGGGHREKCSGRGNRTVWEMALVLLPESCVIQA